MQKFIGYHSWIFLQGAADIESRTHDIQRISRKSNFYCTHTTCYNWLHTEKFSSRVHYFSFLCDEIIRKQAFKNGNFTLRFIMCLASSSQIFTLPILFGKIDAILKFSLLVLHHLNFTIQSKLSFKRISI